MYSLSVCGIGAFITATNMVPQFNKWFALVTGAWDTEHLTCFCSRLQLVEYPSENYGNTVLLVRVSTGIH